MIRHYTLYVLCLLAIPAFAQRQYEYSPTDQFPYGKAHPEAPEAFLDYAPLIGISDCKSVSRVSQSEWADTVSMEWHWKYIMNGWALQDETLKADGTHSGSIRQYNADSAQWYVHYYTSSAASSSLRTWKGSPRAGGDILLYNNQPAPNGAEGYFMIRFSEITNHGFNWEGAWTDLTETIHYPTWRIFCTKRVK